MMILLYFLALMSFQIQIYFKKHKMRKEDDLFYETTMNKDTIAP